MKKPTRNYIEILSEIDIQLKSTNLETDRLLLLEEIRSGSTAGEICSSVGFLLNSMKSRIEIDNVIGEQISEFLNYCRYNGLIINTKRPI